MSRRPRKVLYVAHNHPRIRPGGAEAYALELYEAMRDGSEQFEAYFLAAAQPPVPGVPSRRDTVFAPVPGANDPHQHYFINDPVNFDWFHCTAKNKRVATESFADFLRTVRPEVVHFQHTLFLGYDLIRVARDVLGPGAAILYTLHEYLPICHHHGQMVRTFNNSPCTHASPRRCHECYPKIAPEQFFLRRQIVQSHFEDVDLFLAPSRFLLDKYVEWGIPHEKIRLEDYGRRSVMRCDETGDRLRRNRLGFFGQFTPFKGVDVLMEALRLLAPGEAELRLHGANLEYQPKPFQKRFNALLEQMAASVTTVGRYAHEQLPQLMSDVDWVVVPSIWWENSPLVIQEAFAHGRPVLCSDIGGMAEKVQDGVNGLHFRAGDATSLADAIRRATTTPGLWPRLTGNIPPVYDVADQVGVMDRLYVELLDRAAVPQEVA
jgi:glycosyltransferase involved in cell wall biosynthesis